MIKKTIDSDKYARLLRGRVVEPEEGRMLISRLGGSEQERDFTKPANCGGVGRIRHFRRETALGWPANPLPIDPACAALGVPAAELLRAQVFQRAGCNWRCWYCFVPDKLLAAHPEHSVWMSADELLDLYCAESDRPAVIDLSGGQPDLAPEWVPWMMEALQRRGLDTQVYLWSDDNLSNDYFWCHLSPEQLELVAGYPNYGRGCCFKGFDRESFRFNTRAPEELFDRQLELFARLVEFGIDVYASVTLTSVSTRCLETRIRRFIDRLQAIDENLPLRTVPVEVKVFSPVLRRLSPEGILALANQWHAVEIWMSELETRFNRSARSLPIHQVHRAGPLRPAAEQNARKPSGYASSSSSGKRNGRRTRTVVPLP